MKRVMVTGARGFVGSKCIGILASRGYEVHAVSRINERPVSPSTWHGADLLQEKSITALLREIKPTHLVHLAWCTKPGEYWNSDENSAWLSAGKVLLRRFAEEGGKAAVAAGTCAEYEWNTGTLSESNTPLRPSTLYGKCKKELFEESAAIASKFKIPVGWGRLFFLYGPAEKRDRLVSSAILSLLSGREFKCTAGKQERDFMHVVDAAGAMIDLLESGYTGACNIATGTGVSVAAVVQTIAASLQRSDLVRLGALKAPEREPQRLVADIGILKSAVGFSPSFDLTTGIADTIRWWKANGGGAR